MPKMTDEELDADSSNACEPIFLPVLELLRRRRTSRSSTAALGYPTGAVATLSPIHAGQFGPATNDPAQPHDPGEPSDKW